MIQAIRGNSTYDTKNGLSVDYPLRYHGEHIKTINCKIHLGVETEVSIFMTGGNRGGNPSSCCMSTKNDQEIIVSRKYESGVEIEGWTHVGCMVQSTATALAETEVTRFVSDEKWGGNTATECMSQKAQHGDV